MIVETGDFGGEVIKRGKKRPGPRRCVSQARRHRRERRISQALVNARRFSL